MSRLPEIERNVEFQFVVGNQLSRNKTSQESRVAIRSSDFPGGLPTKDEVLNDSPLRNKLAVLFSVFPKLEVTNAYWCLLKKTAIGIIRYLESPPSWRPNALRCISVANQGSAVQSSSGYSSPDHHIFSDILLNTLT